MSRLIDADDFVEAIKGVEVSWYLDGNYETYDDSAIMDIIEEQPTVEAVPVVHGKWKMRGGRLYCTNCEKKALEEKDRDDWYGCIGSNFCPHCGADMRTSAE